MILDTTDDNPVGAGEGLGGWSGTPKLWPYNKGYGRGYGDGNGLLVHGVVGRCCGRGYGLSHNRAPVTLEVG